MMIRFARPGPVVVAMPGLHVPTATVYASVRPGDLRVVASGPGVFGDAQATAKRLEERFAYVHFTALPPLCFDTLSDPHWRRDLAAEASAAGTVGALARRMLSWRMRYAERRLTGCKLTPAGLIGRYDPT